jgi:hypothetical protein
LVPQLQQEGIKDTVVLQLDGAPPHFTLHVRDNLNKTFPGGGLEEVQKLHLLPLLGPQEVPIWQHQTMLWGFIKERVSKNWYHTTEVLLAAVEEAFTHLTPDYLCKTSART